MKLQSRLHVCSHVNVLGEAITCLHLHTTTQAQGLVVSSCCCGCSTSIDLVLPAAGV